MYLQAMYAYACKQFSKVYKGILTAIYVYVYIYI